MADETKKMSPKDYRKYLKKINLSSILFKNYNVKSHKERIESDMKLDVKFDTSYIHAPNDREKVIISQEYRLKAYKKRKKDFALQINCTLEIILESDSEIREDFLDIYVEVNLNHNTWPYFREFVQNATLRVGTQPLTLPFFL